MDFTRISSPVIATFDSATYGGEPVTTPLLPFHDIEVVKAS